MKVATMRQVNAKIMDPYEIEELQEAGAWMLYLDGEWEPLESGDDVPNLDWNIDEDDLEWLTRWIVVEDSGYQRYRNENEHYQNGHNALPSTVTDLIHNSHEVEEINRGSNRSC